MISNQYRKYGVTLFYKKYGNMYKNPHEKIIKKLLDSIHIHGNTILDLACGNGEVTNLINKKYNVSGLDPYMYKSYIKKFNKKPLKYTFKQITNGVLINYSYDTIICSFALHLVPISMLSTKYYI